MENHRWRKYVILRPLCYVALSILLICSLGVSGGFGASTDFRQSVRTKLPPPKFASHNAELRVSDFSEARLNDQLKLFRKSKFHTAPNYSNFPGHKGGSIARAGTIHQQSAHDKLLKSQQPYAGSAFADAIAKIADGGWAQLNRNKIAAHWPKYKRGDMRRGVTGPRSVLDAWCGMAWDRRNLLGYAHCGGHADYGGNEVYEFSILTGLWRRIMEPAPLVMRPIRKSARPVPKKDLRPFPKYGPSASHTYDGVYYHSGKLYVIPSIGYAPHGYFPIMRGEWWELDLSKAPSPAAWRRMQGLKKVRGTFYRTTRLADGVFFLSGKHRDGAFDHKTGRYQVWGDRANFGDGTAAFDRHRNTVWSTQRKWLVKNPVGKKAIRVSKLAAGVSGGSGLAVRNGMLYFWNGGRAVTTYDPDKKLWERYVELRGPKGSRRIYSKWIYLARYDVFIGVSSRGREGDVWVYKAPKDSRRGKRVGTRTVASYINSAQSGAAVRIPPGIYNNGGALIKKPITLDLEGVDMLGSSRGKGYLIVRGHKRGPRIIRNFRITRRPGGNIAAIRGEANPHIILKHVYAANMGGGLILTGNDGGIVRIEDSEVRMGAKGRRFGQNHNLYIGVSDRLEFIRSKSIGHNHGGHLLKSRADITLIEDSLLDGAGTRHSRCIDWNHKGRGVLTIRKSTCIQSRKSDNDDIIGIARESRNRNAVSTVMLDGATFVHKWTKGKPRFASWNGKVKWKVLRPTTFYGKMTLPPALEALGPELIIRKPLSAWGGVRKKTD